MFQAYARGHMKKDDRVWQAVISLVPLSLFIVYLWNPGQRRELIFDVAVLGLALWSILRNPFRGRPRPALFFSVVYAAVAVSEAVGFLHRHQLWNAVLVGVFLAFAVGWWYRYRQDVNFRDRSSITAGTSRPDMNHG